MSRIDLNNNWLFTPAWSEGFCTGTESAEHLQEVRLPHTCREVPFHYFDESLYQMVCGYRRTVSAPESWAGKRVLLHIGAAGHSADVFLNGTHIGGHRCGYTAFTVELTGHLLTGRDNMLAIRVDSRESQDFPPFGYVIDYMTYGGLYREVSLEVLEPVYLEDVFAKPIITAGLPQEDQDHVSAMLESEIMLNGAAENAGTLYIRQKLYEGRAEDAEKLSAETFVPAESLKTETRTVHGEERRVHILEMKSTAVRLWSVERPLLYSLRTELLCVGGGEETLLDSRITTLGFRSAVFYRDGFYLNGRKLKLIGLNRHQSWPYVGYAMPASQQRLDADILKFELGLNAVRTSHYPQSQAFLDRCDEIGLLVFTEIPGWQHIGGEEWKKQAVRNVEDMVLQDRAHPSVILWGVRINESVDDDPLYEKTNAVARALDPTRQTSGVRCYKRSHLLEDVYAYNDFSHNGTNGGCEKKKNVTSDPDRPYFISESNGHMFPTKAFDSEGHRQAHALRHATVVDAALGEEDIAGVFGWCMFDYNTHKDFGSGDRICYHGVMDMFRNPKLAAALYSSQQEETPVLEISSGMNMG
ncbi:MAG: glycoside hydrolase family 2 protein, partial [Clostridia bacterium]|nr:glycoside hydrolase family 2 protein [Clostridia bacterium]